MPIAPCGLDCDACPQKPEQCDGCLSDSDHVWCADCAIRVCCRFEKKLPDCSFCDAFPCRTILNFENDKYDHHTATVQHLRERKAKRT